MTEHTYVIRRARILGADAADLVLRDGAIAEITAPGAASAPAGATEVDADGLVLLPGLVDLHTHLREPGREDAETVESGTPRRRGRRLHRRVRDGQHRPRRRHRRRRRAGAGGSASEAGLRRRPAGRRRHRRSRRRAARRARRDGRPARRSVRVFTDDGKCVHDAVLMRRALEYVKAFDGVVAQHAQEPRLTEDAQMNEGALSGVARSARLARGRGGGDHRPRRPARRARRLAPARLPRLHRRIGRDHPRAKARGVDVTAEVTPHHLLLTDELAASTTRSTRSTRRCAPRPTSQALREALADGTIDVVATDHAPHPVEDKDCEWSAAAIGMLGLETALGVVAESMVGHRAARLGRRRRPDVGAAGADRPPRGPRPPDRGRRAGQPHAGRPDASRTVEPAALASRSRNTPFAGRTLPSRVVATFLRGRATVLDGELVEAGA